MLIGEINIHRLSEYLCHISANKEILTIIIDRRGQIVARPSAAYGEVGGLFGVADRYGQIGDKQDAAMTPQQFNVNYLPMMGAATDTGGAATGRFRLSGQDMLGSVV